MGVEAASTDCVGVEAASTDCVGVEAVSTDRVGVEAISADRVGVEAVSTDCVGVEAISTDRAGVEAVSTDRVGVEAVSTDHVGVEAASTDCVGVEAVSTDRVLPSVLTNILSGVSSLAPFHNAQHHHQRAAPPSSALCTDEVPGWHPPQLHPTHQSTHLQQLLQTDQPGIPQLDINSISHTLIKVTILNKRYRIPQYVLESMSLLDPRRQVCNIVGSLNDPRLVRRQPRNLISETLTIPLDRQIVVCESADQLVDRNITTPNSGVSDCQIVNHESQRDKDFPLIPSTQWSSNQSQQDKKKVATPANKPMTPKSPSRHICAKLLPPKKRLSWENALASYNEELDDIDNVNMTVVHACASSIRSMATSDQKVTDQVGIETNTESDRSTVSKMDKTKSGTSSAVHTDNAAQICQSNTTSDKIVQKDIYDRLKYNIKKKGGGNLKNEKEKNKKAVNNVSQKVKEKCQSKVEVKQRDEQQKPKHLKTKYPVKSKQSTCKDTTDEYSKKNKNSVVNKENNSIENDLSVNIGVTRLAKESKRSEHPDQNCHEQLKAINKRQEETDIYGIKHNASKSSNKKQGQTVLKQTQHKCDEDIKAAELCDVETTDLEESGDVEATDHEESGDVEATDHELCDIDNYAEECDIHQQDHHETAKDLILHKSKQDQGKTIKDPMQQKPKQEKDKTVKDPKHQKSKKSTSKNKLEKDKNVTHQKSKYSKQDKSVPFQKVKDSKRNKDVAVFKKSKDSKQHQNITHQTTNEATQQKYVPPLKSKNPKQDKDVTCQKYKDPKQDKDVTYQKSKEPKQDKDLVSQKSKTPKQDKDLTSQKSKDPKQDKDVIYNKSKTPKQDKDVTSKKSKNPKQDKDVTCQKYKDPKQDKDLTSQKSKDLKQDKDVTCQKSKDPKQDKDLISQKSKDPKQDKDLTCQKSKDPKQDKDVTCQKSKDPKQDKDMTSQKSKTPKQDKDVTCKISKNPKQDKDLTRQQSKDPKQDKDLTRQKSKDQKRDKYMTCQKSKDQKQDKHVICQKSKDPKQDKNLTSQKSKDPKQDKDLTCQISKTSRQDKIVTCQITKNSKQEKDLTRQKSKAPKQDKDVTYQKSKDPKQDKDKLSKDSKNYKQNVASHKVYRRDITQAQVIRKENMKYATWNEDDVTHQVKGKETSLTKHVRQTEGPLEAIKERECIIKLTSAEMDDDTVDKQQVTQHKLIAGQPDDRLADKSDCEVDSTSPVGKIAKQNTFSRSKTLFELFGDLEAEQSDAESVCDVQSLHVSAGRKRKLCEQYHLDTIVTDTTPGIEAPILTDMIPGPADHMLTDTTPVHVDDDKHTCKRTKIDPCEIVPVLTKLYELVGTSHTSSDEANDDVPTDDVPTDDAARVVTKVDEAIIVDSECEKDIDDNDTPTVISKDSPAQDIVDISTAPVSWELGPAQLPHMDHTISKHLTPNTEMSSDVTSSEDSCSPCILPSSSGSMAKELYEMLFTHQLPACPPAATNSALGLSTINPYKQSQVLPTRPPSVGLKSFRIPKLSNKLKNSVNKAEKETERPDTNECAKLHAKPTTKSEGVAIESKITPAISALLPAVTQHGFGHSRQGLQHDSSLCQKDSRVHDQCDDLADVPVVENPDHSNTIISGFKQQTPDPNNRMISGPKLQTWDPSNMAISSPKQQTSGASDMTISGPKQQTSDASDTTISCLNYQTSGACDMTISGPKQQTSDANNTIISGVKQQTYPNKLQHYKTVLKVCRPSMVSKLTVEERVLAYRQVTEDRRREEKTARTQKKKKSKLSRNKKQFEAAVVDMGMSEMGFLYNVEEEDRSHCGSMWSGVCHIAEAGYNLPSINPELHRIAHQTIIPQTGPANVNAPKTLAHLCGVICDKESDPEQLENTLISQPEACTVLQTEEMVAVSDILETVILTKADTVGQETGMAIQTTLQHLQKPVEILSSKLEDVIEMKEKTCTHLQRSEQVLALQTKDNISIPDAVVLEEMEVKVPDVHSVVGLRMEEKATDPDIHSTSAMEMDEKATGTSVMEMKKKATVPDVDNVSVMEMEKKATVTDVYSVSVMEIEKKPTGTSVMEMEKKATVPDVDSVSVMEMEKKAICPDVHSTSVMEMEKKATGTSVMEIEKKATGPDVHSTSVMEKEKNVIVPDVHSIVVMEMEEKATVPDAREIVIVDKLVIRTTVTGTDMPDRRVTKDTESSANIPDRRMTNDNDTESGTYMPERRVTTDTESGADMPDRRVTNDTEPSADMPDRRVTNDTESDADMPYRRVINDTESGADMPDRRVTDDTAYSMPDTSAPSKSSTPVAECHTENAGLLTSLNESSILAAETTLPENDPVNKSPILGSDPTMSDTAEPDITAISICQSMKLQITEPVTVTKVSVCEPNKLDTAEPVTASKVSVCEPTKSDTGEPVTATKVSVCEPTKSDTAEPMTVTKGSVCAPTKSSSEPIMRLFAGPSSKSCTEELQLPASVIQNRPPDKLEVSDSEDTSTGDMCDSDDDYSNGTDADCESLVSTASVDLSDEDGEELVVDEGGFIEPALTDTSAGMSDIEVLPDDDDSLMGDSTLVTWTDTSPSESDKGGHQLLHTTTTKHNSDHDTDTYDSESESLQQSVPSELDSHHSDNVMSDLGLSSTDISHNDTIEGDSVSCKVIQDDLHQNQTRYDSQVTGKQKRNKESSQVSVKENDDTSKENIQISNNVENKGANVKVTADKTDETSTSNVFPSKHDVSEITTDELTAKVFPSKRDVSEITPGEPSFNGLPAKHDVSEITTDEPSFDGLPAKNDVSEVMTEKTIETAKIIPAKCDVSDTTTYETSETANVLPAKLDVSEVTTDDISETARALPAKHENSDITTNELTSNVFQVKYHVSDATTDKTSKTSMVFPAKRAVSNVTTYETSETAEVLPAKLDVSDVTTDDSSETTKVLSAKRDVSEVTADNDTSETAKVLPAKHDVSDIMTDELTTKVLPAKRDVSNVTTDDDTSETAEVLPAKLDVTNVTTDHDTSETAEVLPAKHDVSNITTDDTCETTKVLAKCDILEIIADETSKSAMVLPAKHDASEVSTDKTSETCNVLQAKRDISNFTIDETSETFKVFPAKHDVSEVSMEETSETAEIPIKTDTTKVIPDKKSDMSKVTEEEESDVSSINTEESDVSSINTEESDESKVTTEESDASKVKLEESDESNVTIEESDESSVTVEESDESKVTIEERDESKVTIEESNTPKIIQDSMDENQSSVHKNMEEVAGICDVSDLMRSTEVGVGSLAIANTTLREDEWNSVFNVSHQTTTSDDPTGDLYDDIPQFSITTKDMCDVNDDVAHKDCNRDNYVEYGYVPPDGIDESPLVLSLSSDSEYGDHIQDSESGDHIQDSESGDHIKQHSESGDHIKQNSESGYHIQGRHQKLCASKDVQSGTPEIANVDEGVRTRHVRSNMNIHALQEVSTLSSVWGDVMDLS